MADSIIATLTNHHILSCPRCIGGQLFVDEYENNNGHRTLFCVQCGHRTSLILAEFKKERVKEEAIA